MKKLLIPISILLLNFNGFSQEKLYLIFEFMKVDNDQETSYMETESFWEKIHEQRILNGDILGWDLWSLQPGGENQGYQYLTVSLYDDPVKMMSNAGDFDKALLAAFPDMTEADLIKNFDNTSKSRDLAERYYLEQIASTKGDFDMPLGTVAGINLMKASNGDYETYENFESGIFLPMHQKEVDDGRRGNWGLLRSMLPTGSDANATHFTVDMYKNYDQLFKPGENTDPPLSGDQIRKIEEGLASRDLKYKYMATLIKKARPK